MLFIVLPLVGALIGWITNHIAIRLLFRPLEPVKLPLGIIFQGLIPKRRGLIAEKVGQIVAEQLFSMEEVESRLDMPVLQNEVDRLTREAVDKWCGSKMGMLPGPVRNYCSSLIRDRVAAEMAASFPKVANSLFSRMREQVNVRAVVAEKINNLELQDVEKLVLDVAVRELRQIERLGAVLGLVIGLLQAVLIHFLAWA